MASGYTNYSGAWLATSAAYKTTIWASGTATVTAGATPTRLVASGQGNVLVGGSYDDTLGINSLKDVYSGGAGVDTAIATVDVILPSDIENLTMDATWSPVFGVANASANIVTAVTANVTIEAMGGDDVIISYGQDGAFIFETGSGKDIVYNFQTGATDSDVARLAGYGFESFADVTAAMTQTGSDVLLTLSSSDLILFKNTTISAFTADNFQLSIDPSKLKLTFADEFSSLSLQTKSAGGGIWATSFAWSGYTTESAHNITGELEVYVDPLFAGTGTTALGLNPFGVSNGALTITAALTPEALKSTLWNYDYTSGLLTTKGTFAQQYGYFEMRADLPEAKGVFPAFWLLPADGSFTAEIDIMEYVGETNIVHNTVHYGPDGDHWVAPSFKSYVADLASGYHTFGLLWTAETLTWYVDGNEVAQIATPDEAKKPMYMLANYAVGGNWAGDPTSSDLPGLAIDYIRAYSLDAAPAASPTVGTSAADTLTGTAGPDTMTGGAGNDLFYVGIADVVVEGASAGTDTVNASVTYTLTDNVENLTLTGSTALSGTGNALDNLLTGNSAANTLTGAAGADTLNGGSGIDRLVGGLGDDLYVLGTDLDVVVETASQGTDTVNVSVSYTLTDNVETLTLTGSTAISGTGNGLNNLLTGNSAANTLTGAAGADTLNGGSGIDRLVGGFGDDLYVLGSDQDVVVETASQGTDTVNVSVSYTLTDNVENLTLTGSSAISGTGNALNNLLTGNSAANTLTGGDGADTLNGGSGIDRLVGGLGDDLYVLGSDQDVVVEAAGQGTDTVTTNLNHSLAVTVENLTLTGAWAAYGYGNDLANVITGNSAANRLEGRANADTLIGGSGADTLLGGVGNDSLTGGAGADVFLFNKGDGLDVITDFGVADVLDLSTYKSAGYTPTLVLSGSDTLVQFSTGEYVRLVGVLPGELTATTSGFIHV
ncbi:family 16 glycosylhydrolase [Phenylobacterium sp. LjRoot225]|uniref:family 16 glycosylhydrolase n=1 Tax=Phenylobacterium sp. LjRoot225 TaxID=3342285 RepID=UPI003ECC2302